MYLLDTNILSATVDDKAGIGAMVYDVGLMRRHEQLYLSAITIAEVEAGIARAVRIGATTKAAKLRHWIATVEHLYGTRILPFGIEEARHAGAILDHARAHAPGFEDIAIAATAAANGLTVLTANERHFAPLGVPFLNPLKEWLPSPSQT